MILGTTNKDFNDQKSYEHCHILDPYRGGVEKQAFPCCDSCNKLLPSSELAIYCIMKGIELPSDKVCHEIPTLSGAASGAAINIGTITTGTLTGPITGTFTNGGTFTSIGTSTAVEK